MSSTSSTDQCTSNGIFMLVIIFMVCGFIIYSLYKGNTHKSLEHQIQTITDTKNNLLKQLNASRDNQKYLWDVKIADENIFDFLRCINFPKTPACRETDKGEMCRSRQIDCNKFKLVLENNPIAVERLKLATAR